MPQLPDLSIIFGTVDRPDPLFRCVKGILEDPSRQGRSVEVVIIDGGDSHRYGRRAYEALKERGVDAHVLLEVERRGHVAAYNAAAGYSSGKALLWLNDDAVIRPGTIGACIDFARKAPWAIGAIDWTDKDGPLGCQSCNGGIPYANFGVLARELWFELGGFSPEYRHCGADCDLSLRAWNSNDGILVVPVTGAAIDHERYQDDGRAHNERDAWSGDDTKTFNAKWARQAGPLGDHIYRKYGEAARDCGFTARLPGWPIFWAGVITVVATEQPTSDEVYRNWTLVHPAGRRTVIAA